MIESARAVADAVLYEGFLLFPYAKSALKNQMPFQFGVVMPSGYADPTEPAVQRSQFVVLHDGESSAGIRGSYRFLQIVDQPVEREIELALTLGGPAQTFPFEIDGLRGEIQIHAEREGTASRVTLEIRNTTECDAQIRNEALHRAFVSAHALLEISGGAFASLLDPPETAAALVAECRNERVFPVLTGEARDKHSACALLVSPIILYDFPQIAAASRARTFDGTEIDELLMLSVASLTDEEKHEARAAHPYVRELVERAEALDADTQRALHGELTGRPAEPGDERVEIGSVSIGRGSRVRVHPKRRADIWDDLVGGMTGRVNAVHTDFEGNRYVGVVFDADPASDMHEWYGRSFFYAPDEVEPIA